MGREKRGEEVRQPEPIATSKRGHWGWSGWFQKQNETKRMIISDGLLGHDSEKCLRHFYFFSIFGGFFAPNQWIVSGKHEYPCHIHTELGAVISVSGWKASPLVPSSCRQVDYNGDARRKKAGGGPIFGHFFSNMFEKHVRCESLLSTFWSVVDGLLPTGKIMMPALSIFSENQ